MALSEQGVLRFAAVCGREPARIAQACVHLKVPAEAQRFTALSTLLAAGACDALILATPDGLHAEQIAQCAERGVHVLAEKPLALTHQDGECAVDKARAAGIVLQVGYHLRHHAGHRLVQSRLLELVGPLRSIAVRWAWPDPAITGWRARGESARFWSLAALGTHGLDLALWFAGSQVDGVSALLWPATAPAQEVDHAAEVSLRFGSGVLAHVSVAVTHRARSRLFLCGERGEIICEGTLSARGDGEIWLRSGREPAERLPFEPHDPYRAQLLSFVTSVQSGQRDAPSDALVNLALLDSIANSVPSSAPRR